MVRAKRTNKLYIFSLILIFALAVFLRLYRINNRWIVDFDQARDAMVAKEALNLKKIPLIGAFSSAGPFVWGPLYYWEIMLSYIIAPKLIFAPWLLYIIFDLLYIWTMVQIGNIVWKERGGLILGLLTTISTAQLLRIAIIHQPTLIPFFGALMILNGLLYLRSKNLWHLFLMGISFGLAINNHFQALNFIFFTLVVIFAEKPNFKKLFTGALVFIIGFLIPLLPLLYWDSTQGWKNINNVLDFFLIGQYRFWVSNRWLIYVGQFWPKLWANLLGDQLIFGYLFMLLSVIFVVYQFLTKKLSRDTLFLAIVFGLMLFINRYYRGERLEGYMLYFYPLVIYFSGFIIVSLLNIKKIIGILFLIILFLFTMKANILLIKGQRGTGQIREIIRKTVTQLKTIRPNDKFMIYDYQYINPTPAMVTSFFLSFNNLIDEQNGTKLGLSTLDFPYEKIATISSINNNKTWIYNLSPYWGKPGFKTESWINTSPKYVALDIMEWWKVKEFKSTFCLFCFIKEKVGIPH